MNTEFGFLDDLKSKYNLSMIGDDCAVLPKDMETDLVVTVDMLVEEIDFRLDWITPEVLGHKALAVSLSDIAAMGALPKWAMLSIAIEEKLWKTDFLDRFYEGWHRLALQYGVELVGGDISRTTDKIVIDSIAGGEVSKTRAILRSGASPGDSIFVSRTLGGAAGGLGLLEGNSNGDSHSIEARDLIRRQLRPLPEVALSNQLQQHMLATAAIDLSDGLSSDLGHICRASSVGDIVDLQDLPIEPNLTSLFPADACLEMALHGGEDFGLIFTGNKEKILAAGIEGISHLGEITANVGIIELIRDGKRSVLEPKGYRHF
ncbi:MAG: thiamine-phosphate kinase [Pyrinomonadaceae bacterium]